MRTAEFWKTKHAAALKECEEIKRKLGGGKQITGVATAAPPISVWVCRHGPAKKRWLEWVMRMRERRALRRRLKMLQTTKINYYLERIHSRKNRTAFDAVQRPLV
jgi:hypothetical protein